MSIFHHMQESFNAGEFSPLMAGRVTLAKYPSALYRLENFILDPRGPAMFRPGWRYIAGTKYNDKVSRLIPFEFSVTQAYELEFGDYYIRFYRNQAQIQLAYSAWVTSTAYTEGLLRTNGGQYYRCLISHTSGTFATDLAAGKWAVTAGATDLAYEIPTPYPEADVGQIKYCQSADVLYLWHASYVPRKLSRGGDTSWSLSTILFRPGAIEEQGIKPAATLTLAALTGTSVVFTASVGVFITGDVGRVISSGIGRAAIVGFNSATQVSCDILDNFLSVGPHASQAWSLLGSPGGLIRPQNIQPVGKIITLTSTAPSETYTNLLDHVNDNWLLSAGGTNEYYLVNTAPMYSATAPDKVYLEEVESTNGNVGSLGIKQWDWGDNDTLGYNTIYVRLSDGADPDTKSTALVPYDDYIKRAAVDSIADLFRASDVDKYVELYGGLVKIRSYVSATQVKAEIIKKMTASKDSVGLLYQSTEAWKIKTEVWTSANGYPSCGTFYEDRLCCAGSTLYPETVWGSVTADYENFTPGADDSDSFSFTISGREVSTIRWIEPDEYLLVGAVSKITRLGPEGSGSVLTPTNVNAKRQSPDGVADMLPVVAGNSVLYVLRTGFSDTTGLKIGELTWSWEKEKYVTPDMTVLANHISNSGIAGICYAKEPSSIIWCNRYDGKVAALTYLREHDVVGWHRHPTDGNVESMATIPGLGRDEVWGIVARTINGSTVRYVEMMEKLFEDDAETYKDNKGLNAFFVDCGITYNGVAATTITGLGHLEGESVVCLADGSYVHPRTVVGGQITLPLAASVVHVGLPYTGIIQTMRPELSLRDGTTQGRVKKVNGGHIRVNESGPFKVGVDENNLEDCFDKERILTFGGSYPLFTGDVPFSYEEHFNEDNRVMIVQDKPMPLTVVAIIQELAI